ncbi:MAG: thiolase domain-containing protein [Chloroflexota bacterium]|nr:thiolase domain-containing protein [Chloroflexota bacterium]
MREVAIIGVGQTPVGEHWDKSIRDLAADVIQAVVADAGLPDTAAIEALYVGNAYGASISSQSQIGALIAGEMLNGIEAFSVDAGEASGAAALRTGYLAVASGLVETVLVLGVEKSTDMIGTARTQARGVSLDADFEAIHGATLTASAALLMRRYMYEHGVDLAAFENFTINAHANGANNPNAMFRNKIKPGGFARAPMVADPVSLFDGAPDGDGAAAVILTSAERAADLVPLPVRIAASAAATDTLALQDRADLLDLRAVRVSVERALAGAGIDRDAIDLFELHDAYTVLAALTLEAAGFAARGQGWTLARDNAIGLTGALPISTFGGLKARGNPMGATGIYQAVEAALQLRGAAGANQVPDARVALIQSLGGLGSTAIAHLLLV